MRISDWSSDVCSSDLQAAAGATGLARTTFQPLTPESIRAGLAAGAVELAYQPKVAVRDHRMIGVEAFLRWRDRSEEHTSELQSLMRISYAVFCLKKKKNNK